MKAVILLIIMLSTLYVLWTNLPKADKEKVIKVVKPYILPILFIATCVMSGLVIMFYNPAISLL